MAVLSAAVTTLQADVVPLMQTLKPTCIAVSSSLPLGDLVLAPHYCTTLIISSSIYYTLACRPCIHMIHGVSSMIGMGVWVQVVLTLTFWYLT